MNSLIKIEHKDRSITYVRYSDIIVVRNWKEKESVQILVNEKMIEFSQVNNINDVIDQMNKINKTIKTNQ